MSRSTRFAAACMVALGGLAATVGAHAAFPGVGRAATPDEIAAWDIDVRPDFKGLPPGRGSVAEGEKLWDAKCTSCHGTFGESNEVFPPLVGGTTAEDIRTGRVKALTGTDARTTLMKVSTVSTLWDYIRRAMPWNAPKSLTNDEVYAVLAYMLSLGDIVPGDFVLSDRNIAEVQQRMPNRNGLTLAHGLASVKGRPDVRNVACMKDCPTEVKLASMLPDYARGSHGNLAEQNRTVGPTRNVSTAAVAATGPVSEVAPEELARRRGCLACHGLDKALVGPPWRDVARRYNGQGGSLEKMIEKVRKGGGGSWGPLAMPPHPDLPEEESRAILRWVLSGAL